MEALVAFMPKSGIITTILGKSTLFTGFAGRERRIHHSKSLPLSLTGERFFFALILSPDGPTYANNNNGLYYSGRARPGAR